jgi:hypothetical protein
LGRTVNGKGKEEVKYEKLGKRSVYREKDENKKAKERKKTRKDLKSSRKRERSKKR